MAAADRGEIDAENLDESCEWVARVVLSVTTIPSDLLDPDDGGALVGHLRRYLLPALRRS